MQRQRSQRDENAPGVWRFATPAVALLCLGLLAFHATSYLPYFPDDSFISLRYAQRFAAGHGLTWTDGERVEGYSNLLWVLLVGAAGAVTRDWVETARVLGGLCAGAALLAIFFRHRATRANAGMPPLFAGAALAAAGPFAAYAIAGLEQPLLAALLAWGLVLSLPLLEREPVTPWRVAGPGLCFGLLAVTRPDGLLFAAAVCAALVLAGRFSREAWRRALLLAALPLGFALAQLAFRRVYYDAWLPNPAHAKLAFTAARIAPGLAYLGDGAGVLAGLLLPIPLALAAAVSDPPMRRRLLLLLLPAVAWSAYVVTQGGDIFPQRRHLVPVVVIAALVGAELLASAAARGRRERIAAALLAALLLAQLWISAFRDPERTRALEDVWHWTGRPVGSFLRSAFGDRTPLLAVDAAGALPFYWEGRTLDMLGLNDRFIAEHPPADLGTGYVGHELGDGAYVLRRRPDLVVFSTPLGVVDAPWRSGREMQASAEFARDYALVTFETPPLPQAVRARIFVRRADGPLGIAATDGRVTVPGYLLQGDPRSVAALDGEGRLGTRVPRDAPAWIAHVPLAPGAWRATAEGQGDLRLAVAAGTAAPVVAAAASVDFDVPAGAEDVRALVRSAAGTGHVRALVFTRR